MQGPGSIFRKDHRKISTLSPLHSEILAVLECRQAEHTQNEVFHDRLALPMIPPKTPGQSLKNLSSTEKGYVRGVWPPHYQPTSHPKTRGRTLSIGC